MLVTSYNNDSIAEKRIIKASNIINKSAVCPVCGFKPDGFFMFDGFYRFNTTSGIQEITSTRFPMVPKISASRTWIGYPSEQSNPIHKQYEYATNHYLENREFSGFRNKMMKSFDPNSKTPWTVFTLQCACGTEWETDPMVLFNRKEIYDIKVCLKRNVMYYLKNDINEIVKIVK